MNGVRCGRPGCAGIIEDGYCDTCGLAQKSPKVAAAGAGSGVFGVGAPGPSAVPSGISGGSGPVLCGRPGCDGMIEDGYCDTCGMAASAKDPAAAVEAIAGPGSGTGAALPGARTGSGGRHGAAPNGGTSSPASGNGPAFGNGAASANPSSARTGSVRGSAVSSRTGSSRTSSGRARGSAVSARTASSRTGSTHGSRSTGRGGLGLGLVEIPQVEYRDPSEAVLSDPQVPEHKRFCSKCGEKVGRSREGRPGRTSGYCAKCGGSYDFNPKLAAGDLIGGQYEVLGCLAHGGLGWIYLATDNNVSGRWVALKGLLDTGDADAMAAAVAERQFLAEVEHPNVVKIYNFVRHQLDDYIVMEYVGGKSLKQIALDYKAEHGGKPLPLEQVLAYAIEILPAFGYLHSIGLLYCDFKPDNVIQSEEQLKLIDMGAVRAFDDEDSAVYGTVGYQAPEIAEHGPSVESDLFTVGRMMAVLSFDFKGFTSTYATTLPPRDSVPVLAKYESFDRALRRATHAQRERRFSSAAEMAVQLTGVLREVLALGDGVPRPAPSTLFTGERLAVGTDLTRPDGRQFASALPIPTVDPTDPNAGALATLGGSPKQIVNTLNNLPNPSTEVYYRLVRAEIEDGRHREAIGWLDLLQEQDPYDWRVQWYRGLLALTREEGAEARAYFEACYDELPGELAPKLALAAAAELSGSQDVALRYYQLVWAVDRSYATAAFAIARLRAEQKDYAGAVEVLGQVPESSIHRTAAEIQAITTRLASPGFADWVAPAELHELSTRVAALGLDGEAHESMVCQVLIGALSWLIAHPTTSAVARNIAQGRVFDADLTEREVRLALERSYRARARMAPDRRSRIELVDQANALRPRTVL
ncbi:MAG TPA: tetratricopeptide repeat protein [Actinocrinis sp.]|uniref:serine/threonine-protein kinase n=1 Tax=Actinocrinis sp. TaxID=1920516 RepID=UPI002D56047E|nr:tetratricopeptide repeat protein [Actinocrinis sp.]HZU54245.1 tetratricopeptide repeat protein [Actinocrinis sp.]